VTGQRDYLEGAEGPHFDSQGRRCGAAGATTPSGVLGRPAFGVDESLAGRYYVRSRDRQAGTGRNIPPALPHQPQPCRGRYRSRDRRGRGGYIGAVVVAEDPGLTGPT